MAFGKYYLQPIQQRLAKRYSFLKEEELNEYNLICTTVRDEGHSFIYNLLEQKTVENKKIKESELKALFLNFIKEKYAWVSNSNLKRLFSQGYYFSLKDGLMEVVE